MQCLVPTMLYTDVDSQCDKLSQAKTISRSRDMVGDHQYLNSSRDLTMPRLGMVCHPWASTCYC